MTQSIGIVTVTMNPAIDQSVAIANFAAGEVNRVDWDQSDPGGKGVNVASFLADLGFRVAVTGFLGSENAIAFDRLFAQKGMTDGFVRIPGKTRVNVKIIDEAQQRITDINFPGQSASADDVAALRNRLAALIPDHEWFVLSGSVPAGIPVGLYGEWVSMLKSAGKRVVLDTSGEPLRDAIGEAPFAIKPNIAELEELLGESLPTQAAVVDAARGLVRDGIQCVVISMGKQGALFVDVDDCLLAVPPAVVVKSTVGAGDAMVAGFVAGKARGWSLADCARLATATAVGALTQLGPRLPTVQTIESLMQQVTVRAVAQ
ncbi:MAG: 1-phosphofructokinase [Sterolibacteriaceae bacterium]|uniref:Phosphofructokinase n=1 Tax=Candidatus Methylophosphatis roskildensis TaxID=2899263 RepID=A0A9D7HMW0_9PROT|nr:1-phosphofructokinase [Candidatus Methylophosphatis roskildensis]MBK7236180.1 1-phosphofructokinase [Sterolibacteriaceae bacterium]